MTSFPLSVSAAKAQSQLRRRLGFPSTPQIPSNSIAVFKVTPRHSPLSSSFRCKGSRLRLQINQKLLAVCATNPNSTGGKLPNEGSDVNETSSAAYFGWTVCLCHRLLGHWVLYNEADKFDF